MAPRPSKRRSALLRSSAVLGLVCAGAAVVAQAPVRLSETPAAKAFLEERYDVALAEFEKLAAANTNNVLVLRFLALSYDRLGRYDDAIGTFKKALALAPENVALLFHSGTTFYNAHYVEDARRNFDRVLSLGPDSEYSKLAQQYLDVLAQQESAQQSPGAARRASLYVQLGYQNDDNTTQAPPGEAEAGTRADRITDYVSVELNAVRSPAWLVGLEFSGYGAQYGKDQNVSKDLWQTGAGVLVQYSGSLGGVPVVGTFKGHQQWVRFDGGPDYSESTGATAGVQAGFTPHSTTRAYWRYTNDRFDDDGFDPAFSSRDGDNQAAGLQHTIFFLDRQAWFTLGAEYQENDADGMNFVFDGPRYTVSLSLPLFYGVRLDLGYDHTEEDYTEFAGPVARETTRREWNSALSRWFGTHVLVRLNYSELNEDSSIATLAYDRRSYGLSVAYVY